MEIDRIILSAFKEYMELFPAVGLIGPRQAGKTTFVKNFAGKENSIYLDLESAADREKLRNAAFYFEQQQDKRIILDEVQFMPGLFNELRGIIDSNRKPGRFILLGSASPELIRNSSDSLAGRIGTCS